MEERDLLEAHFLFDEINKAVWNYDSEKIPRPDGYILGFSSNGRF